MHTENRHSNGVQQARSKSMKWRSWRSPLVQKQCLRERDCVVSHALPDGYTKGDCEADAVRRQEQEAFIASLPSIFESRPTFPTPRTESSPSLPRVPIASPASTRDHAAVKRERRFRNTMRARGGRVRTNEEMRGCSSRDRALDTCNIAIASTDEAIKAVGAWHARCSTADGSKVVLQGVFASLPGRVMYLHDPRRRGVVPPSLGNMNAYGSEGPKNCTGTDAARRAATTPPSLGSMNPYGGEGPPRARKTQVTQLWASFQALESWMGAHGFPSRTARRGEEKKICGGIA